MILKDRKQLAKLMVIQDLSQRDLAEQIGWKSHSYLGRLLRGKITSVTPEVAVRIALALGVGVDDLFLARTSTNADVPVKRRGSAA